MQKQNLKGLKGHENPKNFICGTFMLNLHYWQKFILEIILFLQNFLIKILFVLKSKPKQKLKELNEHDSPQDFIYLAFLTNMFYLQKFILKIILFRRIS